MAELDINSTSYTSHNSRGSNLAYRIELLGLASRLKHGFESSLFMLRVIVQHLPSSPLPTFLTVCVVFSASASLSVTTLVFCLFVVHSRILFINKVTIVEYRQLTMVVHCKVIVVAFVFRLPYCSSHCK